LHDRGKVWDALSLPVIMQSALISNRLATDQRGLHDRREGEGAAGVISRQVGASVIGGGSRSGVGERVKVRAATMVV
jgi:hypothetical protein